MWKALAGLLTGIAVMTGMTTSGGAAELQVGDAAPDFALMGSDGKTYKLSELKGKYVVVAWFPKAFTGGCTAECKSLRASGEALRKLSDVAYFTASCDDVDTNTKFAKSLNLDYPILSDPSGETATAYGVVTGTSRAAKRWTFYIGPDGKVLFIDKAVKAQSHGEDVAAKLKELGAKEK